MFSVGTPCVTEVIFGVRFNENTKISLGVEIKQNVESLSQQAINNFYQNVKHRSYAFPVDVPALCFPFNVGRTAHSSRRQLGQHLCFVGILSSVIMLYTTAFDFNMISDLSCNKITQHFKILSYSTAIGLRKQKIIDL